MFYRCRDARSTKTRCTSSGFKKVGKAKGIYLVAFRLLNGEKRVLVYNYIYYPYMFYTCLINYLISIRSEENRPYYAYREGGHNLIVVDEQFDLKKSISSLNEMNLHFRALCHGGLENYEILQYTDKINIRANYETTSSLILSACNKEYSLFLITILKLIPGYRTDELGLRDSDWLTDVSLINKPLFVVEDINLFLESVQKKILL